MIAYENVSKAFSSEDCNTREQQPATRSPGMLLGAPLNAGRRSGFRATSIRSTTPAGAGRVSRRSWTALRRCAPRICAIPLAPPILFGSESFLDEMAVATNTDPIEFRLRYLKKDREHEVIRAAAKQYGWDTRPSPRNDQGRADVAVGRGFALPANADTYIASIAEVRVHRDTGVIEIPPHVCAHDCGVIVNPETIRHVIDRQMV